MSLISEIIYAFNQARKERYSDGTKDFDLFWHGFNVRLSGIMYRFNSPKDAEFQFKRQMDIIHGTEEKEGSTK